MMTEHKSEQPEEKEVQETVDLGIDDPRFINSLKPSALVLGAKQPTILGDIRQTVRAIRKLLK